jgi:hypothetical protein
MKTTGKYVQETVVHLAKYYTDHVQTADEMNGDGGMDELITGDWKICDEFIASVKAAKWNRDQSLGQPGDYWRLCQARQEQQTMTAFKHVLATLAIASVVWPTTSQAQALPAMVPLDQFISTADVSDLPTVQFVEERCAGI